MFTDPARVRFPSEFKCQLCASPSIAVSVPLDVSSEVSCGKCGRFVATWGHFCQHVDGFELPAAPPTLSPAGYVQALR